jgi:hypothetical protein
MTLFCRVVRRAALARVAYRRQLTGQTSTTGRTNRTTSTKAKLTTAMKRKEAPSTEKSTPKKARPAVPEYHTSAQVKEKDGSIQWPAPKAQIERAREIILQW